MCFYNGTSSPLDFCFYLSLKPLAHSLKVSLDPVTKKPVAISPLKTENEQERLLYEKGQENYNIKKQLAKATLRKNTPNDEESDLIHALWLKQLDYHGM